MEEGLLLDLVEEIVCRDFHAGFAEGVPLELVEEIV